MYSTCSCWLHLGGVVLSKLVVMDTIEVSIFPHILQVIVGERHRVRYCGKQEPKDCMLPHLIISHLNSFCLYLCVIRKQW